MASNQSTSYWSNLALLRLGAFSYGINGLVLAMDVIILPALVLEVAADELKNTYVGLLGFSGLLVAAVAQPVVGRISDRTRSPLGRRVPYLLWACVLVCLGLAGVGLAGNYLTLFAVWLFIQLSLNIGYGPCQALIQDLVPRARIGAAASFKILSDTAGSVALIAISGALIGWRSSSGNDIWLWVALGLLGVNLIAATAITSRIVRTREQLPPLAAAESVSNGGQLWTGLHPQLKRFLVSRFLIITGIAVFQTYGLFFLQDVVGLENPAQALGNMILVVGGALALSVYPAGRLSDRIGRKPVILIGAIGAAVSTSVMLTADNALQVLLIASLIGMSVGALLSANWALANDLGTAGREAQHIGIVNLATVAGSAGAKVMGPGVDLLNQAQSGSGYTALLISCGAMFLIGAAVLMPLKAENSIMEVA